MKSNFFDLFDEKIRNNIYFLAIFLNKKFVITSRHYLKKQGALRGSLIEYTPDKKKLAAPGRLDCISCAI